MRIAFISAMAGYPWGGSELLWSEAAKRLLAAGHHVLAVPKKWPEPPEPIRTLAASGAKIVESEWQGPSRIAVWRARLLRRPVAAPGFDPIWKQVVEFRPDLICVSHGSIICGLDWMIRCRTAGIPYVSIAHSNFEQWWPDDNAAERIVPAYQGAARAYFVSKANLSLFERQLGVRFVNAEIVRNPVNVAQDFQPAWPANEGIYRLATVGRLEPTSKAQDLLILVLAMPKWRDRALRVTLFGDGPWERSLKRLVEREALSDRITFAGHVSDIREIWTTHHALVQPSRYEGLPITIVEAMLCGRLSIVTDVAGNGELLEDNVTGFIAGAPTVAALDEAMERAWQRREEWQDIGAAASKSIRQQIPEDPAQVFADKLTKLIGSD